MTKAEYLSLNPGDELKTKNVKEKITVLDLNGLNGMPRLIYGDDLNFRVHLSMADALEFMELV